MFFIFSMPLMLRSPSFKIRCVLKLLRRSNLFFNFESLWFASSSQYACHYVWSSKSLQVVENYVGHGDSICLVSKYDVNVIIPFLTMVFEALLNHMVQTCVMTIDGLVVGCNDFIKGINIFGVGASMEKSLCALLVWELFYPRSYL